MAGMKNGHDDPKIASLAEARRKAQARAKSGATSSGSGGPATLRDRVIGLVFIAMALGLIVSLVLPFFKGAL